MKFKTRDGSTQRLALLSGHVALVTGEWEELNERFHSAAYAAGCMSEDMAVSQEVPKEVIQRMQGAASLKAEVRTAMEKLLEDGDASNFTTGGKPRGDLIKKMIGKTVASGLRDEVWHTLVKERSVDDAQSAS